jgi:hypothetical protein
MRNASTLPTQAAKNGYYIYGLYLEGATWQEEG